MNARVALLYAGVVREFPGPWPPKTLLQGAPKAGKTTAVQRLVELLRLRGDDMAGFVTRELTCHGRRVGFAVRDLNGVEAVIAHENAATGVRVGRFGVDVPAFEAVAIPAMRRAFNRGSVLIIDEIARMELASAAFETLITAAVDRPAPLVATVHARHHPTTDALLARPDVHLVQVTAANRERLPGLLLSWLAAR